MGQECLSALATISKESDTRLEARSLDLSTTIETFAQSKAKQGKCT